MTTTTTTTTMKEDSTEHSSLTSKSSSGSLIEEDGSSSASTATTTAENQLLYRLSPEELEQAARANIEYWKQKQQSQQQPLNDPSSCQEYSSLQKEQEQQRRLARPLAKRFLHSQKYNLSKAAQRLKENLKFRQKMQVDQVYTCFSTTRTPPRSSQEEQTEDQQPLHYDTTTNNDDEDSTSHSSFPLVEQQLRHDLEAGHVYVQGYDREGRSTVIFLPRQVPHHDSAEATLRPHIYTLERAIACSRCHNDVETVNAIVDFAGFSIRQHAPPLSIGRVFLQTLRQHYAGVLHRIFLLNAPTSFVRLWNVLQSFVAPATREKIRFVNTTKTSLLQELYDPGQATPWMMHGGHKTRTLDIREYLDETPFDQAFDDNK